MGDSILFPIKDFRAAWIPDSVEKDPDNIPDNGLEQADNADINGLGGLSKRKGSTKFNAASYTANVKQNDEWLKSNGTVQLWAIIGTDFCSIAEDGTKTIVQTLNASANKIFWFPTITGGTDLFYFGDGYKYFVWNGTTCGEVSPAEVYLLLNDLMTKYIAHCARGTGTHTTADVVNNNPTAIANTLLASLITSANSWKAKYNAHDNETGTYHIAAGVAHQVAAADATDITSLITLLNAEKVAYGLHIAAVDIHTAADTTNTITAATATEDLSFVKGCHMAVYHSKSHRYFFAKTTGAGVVYSEPDDPTNVKALSILYPIQVEGNIVGLDEFVDALVVRFNHGAWYWRGYNPTANVVWFPIPLKAGGFNPWDCANVDGSMFFPGAGGIYTPGASLLGTNVTVEASGDLVPNIALNRVASVIASITNEDIVCTIDDINGGKTYIAYTDVVSATSNSKVLVWHRQNGGGFTRYLGWNVNHWCLRKNGDLLFATNNYIMKAKQTAYNDNGAAIHFLVKTKWYSFGVEIMNRIKRMFEVYLTSQQNAFNSTVDVTTSTDNGADSVIETGISLNTGFVWGDLWGGIWGAPAIITKVIKTHLKGLRFQTTLENNVIDDAVDIYGLNYRFKIGKPKGEKV